MNDDTSNDRYKAGNESRASGFATATRRGVLAGMGAVAVAPAAVAQTTQGLPPQIRIIRTARSHKEFAVEISDSDGRRILLDPKTLRSGLVPQCESGVWKKVEINKEGKPEIRDTPYIKNVRFQGVELTARCSFDLVLELVDVPADGSWAFRASLEKVKFGDTSIAQLPGEKPLPADTIFAPAMREEFIFKVAPKQAVSLLPALYGRRVRSEHGGGALSLGLSLAPIEDGAVSTADRAPRFSLVSDAGLIALRGSVGFNRMDMRFVGRRAGEGAWVEDALACNVRDTEVKTAPTAVAPLAVTGSPSTKPDKKSTEKSKKSSAPARSVAKTSAVAVRSAAAPAHLPSPHAKQPQLSCEVPPLPREHSVVLQGIALAPKWRREIPTNKTIFLMGPLADKDLPRSRKHPPSRPIVAVTFERGKLPPRVVFRGADHPRNTIALLYGAMEAELLSTGDAAPRCTFNLARGLIVRQDRSRDDKETIFETLRGAISEKPFELETAYGSLIIEGDPEPDAAEKRHGDYTLDFDPDKVVRNGDASQKRGGADSTISRPPVHERAPAGLTQLIASSFEDRLQHFSARARLRQLPIVLPPDTDAGLGGNVWSRFEFSGSEIAFRLPLDADDGWKAEGAAGLVVLGVAPAKQEGGSRGSSAGVPGFEIALDGARLQARRESDNLALSFGFAGLVLRLDGGGAGAIFPDSRRNPDGAGRRPSTGGRQGAEFDRRARLIVNFPPQHVAEKAYFRQIDDGVRLPEPPRANVKKLEFGAALFDWRNMPGGTDEERTKRNDRRKEIFDVQRKATNDDKEKKYADYLDLCDTLSSDDKMTGAAARLKAVPPDQRLYLGADPLALDPDVRALLLGYWRAKKLALGASDKEAAIARALANAPESLPQDVVDAIQRQFKDEPARYRRFVEEWTKRYAFFEEYKKAYKSVRNANMQGRTELRQQLFSATPDKLATALKEFAQIDEAFAAALRAKGAAPPLDKDTDPFADPFDEVTPARLSGASRLVFRVQGVSAESPIPFTLKGLTDWGRFDLAVVRRARTVEKLVGERLPHESIRAEEGDPARILAYMGIRPNRSIAGRLEDVRRSLKEPEEDETAIEIPFRLILSPDQFSRFRTDRGVDKAVFRSRMGAEPNPVLWSAELVYLDRPARLRAVWSPDFQPGVFEGGHAPRRGPWAPWNQSLENPEAEIFRTALDAYDRHEIVALSSVHGLPVLGRRALEGHGLVDSSQFEPPEGYRLQGLKPAVDRDTNKDLGDLSAIYQPQPLDVAELRLSAFGGSLRHDTGFIPPAAPYRAKEDAPLFDAFSIERWRQVTMLGRDIEVEVVYKGYLYPLGVRASLIKLTERRFMKSPKGVIKAFLVQRKFIRIGKPRKDFPAIGQPDQSRRFPVSRLDMLTRVTPDIIDPDREAPSVPLNPADSAKTNMKYAEMSGGRVDFAWDVSSGAGNTNPSGLVFWPRTTPGEAGNIKFEFTVNAQGGALRMPLLFVDNVAANNPRVLASLMAYYNQKTDPGLRTVRHGGVKRRYADELSDGDCSFETDAWVLLAEGRRGDAPVGFENKTEVVVAGQEASTAESNKNYNIPTPSQNFENDPFLEGLEQPPFYPFVGLARIRVGQAERFVGRSLPLQDVIFAEKYRAGGFWRPDPGKPEIVAEDGVPEIYLQICAPFPLDMGDAGDRSGGLGRPALELTYLSRKIGIAGKQSGPTAPQTETPPPPTAKAPVVVPQSPAAPARATKEMLGSFFHDDAKILGLVSFKELLTLVVGDLQFPDLDEKIAAATEETSQFIRSQIVPGVQKAIDAFDAAWKEAALELSKNLGDVFDLGTLYPDVAPALDDLRQKTRATGEAQGLAIVAALTEFQHSGRRFVTVVQRLAEDPVAPLKEKARFVFRDLRNEISKFQNGMSGIVKDAVAGELAKIKNALDDYLSDLLKTDKLAPIAQLMVVFPYAETLTASDVVNKALLNASQAATKAYLQAVVDGTSSPLGALRDAASRQLKADIDKLSDDAKKSTQTATDEAGKAAKEAKESLEAVAKKVNALKDDEIERVLGGPLLLRYFGASGDFAKVRADIQKFGAISFSTLGADLGVALKNVASSFLQHKVDKWKAAACQDVIAPLVQFIGGALAKSWDAKTKGHLSPKELLTLLATYLDGQGTTIPNAKIDAAKIKQLVENVDAAIVAINGVQSALDACKAKPAEQLRLASAAIQRALGAMNVIRQSATELIEVIVLQVASRSVKPAVDATPEVKALADKAAATSPVRYINDFLNYVQSSAKTEVRDIEIVTRDLVATLKAFFTVEGSAADQFDAALGEIEQRLSAAPDKTVSQFAIDNVRSIRTRLRAVRDFNEKVLGKLKDLDGIKAEPGTGSRFSVEPILRQLDDLFQKTDFTDQAYNSLWSTTAPRSLAAWKQAADSTVIAITGDIASAQQELTISLANLSARLLQPLAAGLDTAVYASLIKLRKGLLDGLGGQQDGGGVIAYFRKLLKAPGGGKLDDIFFVGEKIKGANGDEDDLVRDQALLTRWATTSTNFANSDDAEKFATQLWAFADGWSRGASSPLKLISNFERVLMAVLRGDISQFIDLQAVKRDIDAEIRKMVPARISQSYDLKLKLGNVGSLIAFDTPAPLPQHAPESEPKTLVVRVRGEIDLFDPKKTTLEAKGFLPGFALNLLPGFDVATIIFPPSTFGGGLGKTAAFTLKIGSVVLGEKVKFLQDLQSIMGGSPDGTGFYIRPLARRGSVGIVAGYGFGLPAITLGNMFIDNLSLQIAAELCFDNQDARFIIGISRVDAPFMISVAPYAGAGHLALIANVHGFIGFEASFQFGGGGGFSFGPLKGKGRISVGIFVRKIEGYTELYGLFYAGGSARIACFSCSAELSVRMQQQGGNMEGEAIFTFSFSIGIKDIHYSVNVFKREEGSKGGGGSGGQRQGANETGGGHRTRFALDLDPADYRVLPDISPHDGMRRRDARGREFLARDTLSPRLVNETWCISENYREHEAYFSTPANPWMFP